MNPTPKTKTTETNLAFEGIINIYQKPKLKYFLPLIGFISYMQEVARLYPAAGLGDKSTPGGQIMARFTKKCMVTINVLLPVYLIFNIFVFNIAWKIWKNVALKAIEANRHLAESSKTTKLNAAKEVVKKD